MRLFVALTPSAEVRHHLADVLAPLQRENVGLRWTTPDAWHLTLAFFGQVDESIRPGLEERLRRAAGRHPVLHLAFGGAGAFGSRRQARVLWVGVIGDREPLRRLAGSVDAAARRAGILTEDRPYRPHLTLARAREPMDLTAPVQALSSYAGPVWTVTSISLINSHLGPVTRHETLASWNLLLPKGS